jgi:mRNA-degrading endonuclease RelE of RelBE toxin-antitoxin system
LKIKFSKSALKALEALTGAEKQRIRNAIKKLPSGDIKKLKGYSVAYRLRVGDMRVLFDMTDEILITNILPRGEAYKR